MLEEIIGLANVAQIVLTELGVFILVAVVYLDQKNMEDDFATMVNLSARFVRN